MLDRFQTYLEKHGSIGPKQIPYYIKWVKDCYAYLDRSLDTSLSGVGPSQQSYFIEFSPQE
jgi:hypothetical protein